MLRLLICKKNVAKMHFSFPVIKGILIENGIHRQDAAYYNYYNIWNILGG